MTRGFYGVGVYHPKNEINIGGIWRSAQLLNASFLFTIGRRYRGQASDTMKAPRHIPMMHFTDFDDFYRHMPYDCRLIGVELCDDHRAIETYTHPERAVYLLGAEDNGLPAQVLQRCQQKVVLPGGSFNVATAASIVMYDRHLKRKKGS